MFNFFKTTKKEPANIKQVLERLKKLDEGLVNLAEDLREFKQKSRRSIQKVGVVRFNPFKEIGGDQSFCIALLDEDNSGVVITSFYGREGNRVYAKPIERGQSKYQLSEEEKEAIARAMGAANSNPKP